MNRATALPQNWQLAIAGWCLSTLLGLIGIAVSVSNRDQVLWLTVISVGLGIAGAGFFGAALSRTLILVRLLPLGNRQLPRFKIGIHSSRWASSARDVADAHTFLASLLPRDPPSLELMQALHQRNPTCIRLVESERGAERALVAMLIVAPLNGRLAEGFRRGYITALSEQLLNDVPRSWQRPRGIYVGGIAGSTQAGRAWILSFLEWFIQQSGTTTLIARPASPDGERVMKSAGFTPIGGSSPFWQRHL